MRFYGKNFQSWKEFDLDISGLTVVIGESDIGKSALFRSLKGLVRNELPADFVRNGQEAPMEVCLELDGQKITATRKRKGSTSYVINGQDFSKLAKSIPDELKNLGFNEITIGEYDVDPIFGRQNSAQFLIDPQTYKPAEINAILGAFGGTEKLEAGKKEANLRKTQKDAEARTLAEQIRDSEERKANLTSIQGLIDPISAKLKTLEINIQDIETNLIWLDEVISCRIRIEPLRELMNTIVLPDIRGLDDLYKFAFTCEQAAESGAYARWLQKPQTVISSVTEKWAEVWGLWSQIVAVTAAIEAGKHIVSTDRLKNSLSEAENTFHEIKFLWQGIKQLEDLSNLLEAVRDSSKQLIEVEEELSAAQTELKKSLCPKCGLPMEHVCQ